MKLSLNWIKKYVKLPEDLTLEKLSHDLTMSTVEVEGIEDLGKSLNNIVSGKIKSVEAHPQADRLRVVMLDIGEEEDTQIVCGGSNLSVGQDVVVAKPGSFVTWHGEGEKVEIKASKLRGVPSAGMICASEEIGLGDLFPSKGDHEIMDISYLSPKPGTPIAELLDLNDFILEIDNKSMTNRPDLWGHYGMARELAAIYRQDLKEIEEVNLPQEGTGFPVNTELPEKCNRYANLVYKNVKIEESPYWMQSDLSKVGISPKNVIVDITNYAMMTTGNPNHAFDFSKIDEKITVRSAKEGEKLVLLSEEEINLNTDDIVIADDKKVVALAGIMGGLDDSIADETQDIIFEVANFNAVSIRHTAKAHTLRTESSIRFEKGIDTARVDQTINVIVELMKELQPEAELVGYTDSYPVKAEEVTVDVPLSFLQKRLGKDLSYEEIKETLDRLGIKSQLTEGIINTYIPSWRATGDLSLYEDIVEEVGRIIGYENFEFIPPTIKLTEAVNQKGVELERRIREYLAFRCGLSEIFTYPWVDETYIEAAGEDKNNWIELEAPPSPEMSHIKRNLVPSIIEACEKNTHYFDKFNIFELSQVFSKGEYSPNDPIEKLPIIERNLTCAFVGTDAKEIFKEAKGVLENMDRYTHMKKLELKQNEKPTWADPKVWLNITKSNEVIGSIGLLSVKGLKTAGIKHHYIALIDLNVEKLSFLPSRTNKFEHLPEFPLVEKDLSVLVPDTVKWQEIEKTVRAKVKKVEFIDEYKGKQIEEGKKSVTFRVYLEAVNQTLTTEQIDQVLKEILSKINKNFGGGLRE